MSHFAKVENSIVVDVIVATQEEINSERHGDSFLWVQCSYNENFRGSYPGVGYTYKNGKFLNNEKPFPSWVLSEEDLWVPPVSPPGEASTEDNSEKEHYTWNEDTTSWVETQEAN